MWQKWHQSHHFKCAHSPWISKGWLRQGFMVWIWNDPQNFMCWRLGPQYSKAQSVTFGKWLNRGFIHWWIPNLMPFLRDKGNIRRSLDAGSRSSLEECPLSSALPSLLSTLVLHEVSIFALWHAAHHDVLLYHEPRSDRARQPWTKNSETASQKEPFLFEVVYLVLFQEFWKWLTHKVSKFGHFPLEWARKFSLC